MHKNKTSLVHVLMDFFFFNKTILMVLVNYCYLWKESLNNDGQHYSTKINKMNNHLSP